jgi:hypothetical protein
MFFIDLLWFKECKSLNLNVMSNVESPCISGLLAGLKKVLKLLKAARGT